MENPLVSVIIPVYNAERFIEQCVASVMGQSLEDIEVICVNDGSTDASPRILGALAAKDDRVRVLDKPNTGYGDSVNQGIARAHGRYIGIVESDDWTDPDMFRTLYGVARENAFPDIVKGSYWRVCDPDTPQQRIVTSFYTGQVSIVGRPFTIDQDATLIKGHPSIWSAIYKRSFLEDNGVTFMPEPGAAWVDNPFMLEAMLDARSIVYVDKELYYYREFNAGSSSVATDPHIIAQRWIDMDNIVHTRHVTSRAVLEAHYSRGCSYIEMLDGCADAGAAARETARMMERIDSDFVARAKGIDPNYKRAYRRHLPALERLSFAVKGL